MKKCPLRDSNNSKVTKCLKLERVWTHVRKVNN